MSYSQCPAHHNLLNAIVNAECKQCAQYHVGGNNNSINDLSVNGTTPLACAVSHNKSEMAEFFLKRGADPSKIDTAGKTAMDYAIANRNAHMMLILKPYVDVMAQLDKK
jgi:ankyrin repeat protein